MTLEDFFTLSEMKDGFGASVRVKELISVMQELKDGMSCNTNDSVRQWSTVAKVLAVTENKECLEYFIQLDGLWFLNYWLQEAQMHCDNCDDSVSKLFLNILGALERLPVDKDVFASSGIGLTLKHVLCQTDIVLQEKIKKLLGNWHFLSEENKDQCLERHGSWHIVELKPNASLMEEGLRARKSLAISSSKEVAECGCGVASIEKNSDNVDFKSQQVHSVACGEDANASSSNQQAQQTASNSGGATVMSGDMNSLTSSNVSNPSQESLSTAEESSACLATRLTSTGTSCSPFIMENLPTNQPGFSDEKDSGIVKDIKYVHEAGPNLCKSNEKEDCMISSHHVLSSAARNLVSLSGELCALGSKESEILPIKMSDPQMDIIDEKLPLYSKISGKHDSPSKAAFQDTCGEASGDAKKNANPQSKGKGADSRYHHGYNNMFRRKTEMEIEYGDDALEFAVQVAMEAEREVADREPCSSSMEGKSEGEVVDSGCSGLEQVKHEHSSSCASPPTKDHLDGRCSPSNTSSRASGNVGNNDKRHDQEPELHSVVLHSREKLEERCIFDLNEGMDCDNNADDLQAPAHNLSAPIAIVATSKGSPGLPVVPLLFHGELRWRSSAATCAFRPASPKRVPECDKIGPTREKAGLEIDLNVADHGDAAAADLFSANSLNLSELPSCNSSLAVGSKGADRIFLDLNCPGDEDPLLKSDREGIHHPKTHSSDGSGSFSAKHISFGGFDLNDTPTMLDVCELPCLSKPCFTAAPTSESCEHGDPDVVILGSRMPTIKKEFNHSWQSSMWGFPMETSMAARPNDLSYPYRPPPSYGYNGAGMAPNAFSFNPRPFGPGSFTHMTDYRGASVVPQVLGLSAGFVNSPSARAFPFGASSSHSGLGASGSSVPSPDLNSLAFSYDSGSRESGSFGKSYVQGHGGLTEEYIHGSHSLESFGVGLKRKEPDLSWGSNVGGYKQMPPSWR